LCRSPWSGAKDQRTAESAIRFATLGQITVAEAQQKLRSIWVDQTFDPVTVRLPRLDDSEPYHYFDSIVAKYSACAHDDPLHRSLEEFVQDAEAANKAARAARYGFLMQLDEGSSPNRIDCSVPEMAILRLLKTDVEAVLKFMDQLTDMDRGTTFPIRELVLWISKEQLDECVWPEDVSQFVLVVTPQSAYLRYTYSPHQSVYLRDTYGDNQFGVMLPIPKSVFEAAWKKIQNGALPDDTAFADPQFPEDDEIVAACKSYVGDEPWPQYNCWLWFTYFALEAYCDKDDGTPMIGYYCIDPDTGYPADEPARVINARE